MWTVDELPEDNPAYLYEADLEHGGRERLPVTVAFLMPDQKIRCGTRVSGSYNITIPLMLPKDANEVMRKHRKRLNQMDHDECRDYLDSLVRQNEAECDGVVAGWLKADNIIVHYDYDRLFAAASEISATSTDAEIERFADKVIEDLTRQGMYVYSRESLIDYLRRKQSGSATAL